MCFSVPELRDGSGLRQPRLYWQPGIRSGLDRMHFIFPDENCVMSWILKRHSSGIADGIPGAKKPGLDLPIVPDMRSNEWVFAAIQKALDEKDFKSNEEIHAFFQLKLAVGVFSR